MKRNDFLLILCVVILAGAVLIWNYVVKGDEGGTVLVYIDGEVSASYHLHEDGEYDIKTEYGKNRLLIKDGQADMTEADCPDSLCVKQHPISRTGETIVCLPHRVVVEIEGALESELDAVAQ